jgi:hypothetical protein
MTTWNSTTLKPGDPSAQRFIERIRFAGFVRKQAASSLQSTSTMWNRFLKAVRRWTGTISKRFASDATLLRQPESDEVVLIVRTWVQLNDDGSWSTPGPVQTDIAMGEELMECADGELVSIALGVPVVLAAGSALSVVKRYEELTGKRIYKAFTDDLNERYTA